MKRGRRRVDQHDVDHFGLVDCPRRGRVGLAECAACSDLVGTALDGAGGITRVRCLVRADD